MIDLSPETKALLLNNSVHREIIIRFPEALEGEIKEIGSNNIIADSLELTQSICDENEFVIGGCIAGQFVIRVINIEQPLNNKRINVFLRQRYGSGELYPSDELLPSDDLSPGQIISNVEVQIFSGVIDSSLRQKNRIVKEIIAYDDFFIASNTSALEYFKDVSIYSPKMDLFTLRETVVDAFLYGGYEYADEFTGFNDSKAMSLTYELVKSVCNSKLTLSDLLKAYCELNACFAYINGEGKIKFIQLINLPVETIEYYSNLTFEEFVTRPINIINFQYNKDQFFKYGFSTGKQSWYISENIITSCCTDVNDIVEAFNDNNGTNYIFYDLYQYRPFTADVYARWWIEPGDKILIKTGYDDTETVESFVFSRSIKGINGLRVELKTQGKEYLGKDEIDNDKLRTN